ncbi:MAG: glutaredoxin family protein [Phycisphaerales bacterium]|nr:glutaredoxin family protein [Phycisphaerales bacterium]
MDELILYGKPGCHLCDVMKEVVQEVAKSRPLRLLVKNILDDPEIYQRYRYDIPVLLVNGREIVRHRVTVGQIESALGVGADHTGA